MTYEVVLPSKITKALGDHFEAILSVKEGKACITATDGFMAIVCQVSPRGFPEGFLGAVERNSLTKDGKLWKATVRPIERSLNTPRFHQAVPKSLKGYGMVYLSVELLRTLLLAVVPFKGSGVFLFMDPKEPSKPILLMNDHGTTAGLLATRMPSEWEQHSPRDMLEGLVRLSEETQP